MLHLHQLDCRADAIRPRFDRRQQLPGRSGIEDCSPFQQPPTLVPASERRISREGQHDHSETALVDGRRSSRRWEPLGRTVSYGLHRLTPLVRVSSVDSRGEVRGSRQAAISHLAEISGARRSVARPLGSWRSGSGGLLGIDAAGHTVSAGARAGGDPERESREDPGCSTLADDRRTREPAAGLGRRSSLGALRHSDVGCRFGSDLRYLEVEANLIENVRFEPITTRRGAKVETIQEVVARAAQLVPDGSAIGPLDVAASFVASHSGSEFVRRLDIDPVELRLAIDAARDRQRVGMPSNSPRAEPSGIPLTSPMYRLLGRCEGIKMGRQIEDELILLSALARQDSDFFSILCDIGVPPERIRSEVAAMGGQA